MKPGSADTRSFQATGPNADKLQPLVSLKPAQKCTKPMGSNLSRFTAQNEDDPEFAILADLSKTLPKSRIFLC